MNHSSLKKCAVIALLWGICAVPSASAWQIENFNVDIEVRKDSSLLVTETILADFMGEPKHGIIRNIPVAYQNEDGRPVDMSFDVLDISDENDRPWQLSETREGVIKKLKIGSPQVTFSGRKTFIIRYEVKGALLYLDDHDELFWNATGTEWDAPINNVFVNVRLPGPVEPEHLMKTAYSGRYGSRNFNGEILVPDDQHVVFTGVNYRPNEGMTVVVGWPKGMVEVVKPQSRGKRSALADPDFPYNLNGAFFRNPMGYLLLFSLVPLFVFGLMYRIWDKHGRDPETHKSVVVEYKAPGALRPAEMGMLIDDRIDMRDISSTIIDLAVRGYLSIIQKDEIFFQKKYAFRRMAGPGPDVDDLAPFEEEIYSGMFNAIPVGGEVELGDLENKFYKNLPEIKRKLFESLKDRGLYQRDPEKTVNFYLGLGTFVLFLTIMAGAFTGFYVPLVYALGVSACVIFGFAKLMPAKTVKGAELLSKVKGFEEFLDRVEKDRIAASERQNIFEKMLPFAVCLGIATKWGKAFEGIYQEPPQWFAGNYPGGFSTERFVYHLGLSVRDMNSTFVSTPRTVSSGGGFGGGGFSGGGGGGGGGSSW